MGVDGAGSEFGAGHRCDNDGAWGVGPCQCGHPRAVAMLKANPIYSTDVLTAFACGDCLPRVREAVGGGGFAMDEYVV